MSNITYIVNTREQDQYLVLKKKSYLSYLKVKLKV